MKIDEILKMNGNDAVKILSVKNPLIPDWATVLRKEYDTLEHPVFNRAEYIDKTKKDGSVEKVTRIGLGLQKLAAKRVAQMCFGVPVKRIYQTYNEQDTQVANIIERILTANRINSVNMKRGRILFAGCEFATVWLAEVQDNTLYGVDSPIKIRCRTYGQMNGDNVYPLWDEVGDLIAISFGYKKKQGDKDVDILETYTDHYFIIYQKNGNNWEEIYRKEHAVGKIPAVYCHRTSPAWEDCSNIVYETEWTLSLNGNYLKKNMKPLFAVFADKLIKFGGEKNEKEESRTVVQFPAAAKADYISWKQAVENLKFHILELRQQFFGQLQLPDWSFDNMKTTPMSGESRKLMFIDSILKVIEEAGDLCEAMEREVNVIKQYVKIILPGMVDVIDRLGFECVITPYTITEEKDIINNLVTATGGKPIISQRRGIQEFGWAKDPDAELQQIQAENKGDNILD
ncbi:MAG: phage portal protein [Bacteroidales bacterium]|jgi:hypothetical protein|nr:phage portal protein [Bacteroidales bacterium]